MRKFTVVQLDDVTLTKTVTDYECSDLEELKVRIKYDGLSRIKQLTHNIYVIEYDEEQTVIIEHLTEDYHNGNSFVEEQY